ncbi:CYTH domain-containing protein [bacterium]|jgi:predicted adenylyl cyclase CyaB|nr:CYTH domain-containing protein [bacterium]
MQQEIEIKIKISEEQKIIMEDWLNKNSKYCGQFEQKNVYIDNPSSSFFFKNKTGQKDALKYLRVRFDKNGDSVCFKNWYQDKGTGMTTHCDEIEYSVSSGESALSLFKEIGFIEDQTMEKKRQKYKTDSLEIVIDQVKSNRKTHYNQGLFAEIELIDCNTDVSKGRKKIFEFLKSLGIIKFTMQISGEGEFAQIDLDKNFP